ncbi:MAG: hypothetical protein N3A61_04270, partial [Ignavibacteria bacterium]|nr:hypothetical protein [Ignavibacteria bacterium]
MEKIFLLIITMTLFININLTAQQYGWVKIAQPISQDLGVVFFVDSLNGWTAYGGSNILKTTDGGFSWNGFFGAPMILKGISMINSLIGWMVGDDGYWGRIVKTTNGGLNYTLQYEKSYKKLFGTSAKSPQINISVGLSTTTSYADTGKIFQTHNGGTNWTERTIGDSIVQLRKITFIDSLHGWITTYITWNKWFAILKTTDGGQNWIVIRTPNLFEALSFIDTLTGWAIEPNRAGIYKTTNGGYNWQFQYAIQDSLPPGLSAEPICFTDSLNGWAFGGPSSQGTLAGGI